MPPTFVYRRPFVTQDGPKRGSIEFDEADLLLIVDEMKSLKPVKHRSRLPDGRPLFTQDFFEVVQTAEGQAKLQPRSCVSITSIDENGRVLSYQAAPNHVIQSIPAAWRMGVEI